MKNFDSWNEKKKVLDELEHQPPLVSEGEIWWISVGKNVGSEMNGKSEFFSRPAIIFKKLAHGFYFIIPTTTQIKEGSWFVNFRQKGKSMSACLQQAKSIDYRRLSSKLGELDDADYARIKEGFKSLYIGSD